MMIICYSKREQIRVIFLTEMIHNSVKVLKIMLLVRL